MRRAYLVILASLVALVASAAGPNGSATYYQNADGKKGSALKTALCGIIYNRTEKSYEYLWTAFYTTDVRSDGKIWDMYSNITNYTPVTSGSSYSVEGDCYNREHSFPQSWFGSNAPMYTDLHHIYPTDGKVNGMRANYPFGEVNNPTYSSANGFSKLGPCSVSGYSGTVFEPADEYKGDFARTYFYMITCYEEKLHDWYTNYSSTDVVHVIDGSTYPGFQTWQLNMLLKWAKDDRVSDKEIARNTAVASIQGNRNPFIDYPGLEQYIWGSKTTDTFSYDNYVQPTTWSTEYNSSGSGGGAGTYKLQEVTSVEAGEMYVFEQSGYVMNNTISSSALQTTNTYNTTGLTGTETYVWTLEAATNGYYMKNASAGAQKYLNNTSSTNVSWGTKSSIWAFNFQTDGTVLIQNKSNSDRFLGYTTASSHVYKAYATGNLSSYPHAIKVYKLVEEVTPSLITSDLALTGAPVALSFDLNTNSAAQVIHYTTSSTGAVTVNSSNYVTTSVDTSNKTITVTPTAVTPSTQTIAVNQAADETYAAGSVTFTVSVTQAAQDYATLPFSWEGGTKSELTGTTGVTASGLGTDYSSHSPYCVRFDDTGDYIQIRTDSQPSKVTINVKMIGGSYTSTITVQESSNSSTFTDVEALSISGSQNNIKILKTSNAFAANTRYVRLYFTKGSNVGIGPITIDKAVSIGSSGYTTFVAPKNVSFPSGVTAYIATGMSSSSLSLSEKSSVPAGTPVILKGSESTYSLTGTTTPESVTGNLLLASNGSVTGGTGIYALAQKNGVVGFYPVASSVTIPAGKAYLVVSGGNVKAFYGFEEDDATGISTMDNGQWTMDNVIYNVAGQRVDNSQFTIHNLQLKRGIYIVNGKKIAIK